VDLVLSVVDDEWVKVIFWVVIFFLVVSAIFTIMTTSSDDAYGMIIFEDENNCVNCMAITMKTANKEDAIKRRFGC
jgi:hypothetical protein